MTLRQKRAFFAEGQGFLEAAPKDRKDEARRAFFFWVSKDVLNFSLLQEGGGNWDDFLHLWNDDSKEVKAEIASVVQALGDTAQPSTGDFKAGSTNPFRERGKFCTIL